jgi:PHD/YefM family antitoxin component YafN of YafNO toxin-antitoxin module
MSCPVVGEEKADLIALGNRVTATGERIVVHRRGKGLALISVEDLELLERLEDQDDARAAREALAESDERIPYEQVRKELGLE